MATRPVFLSTTSGSALVRIVHVDFVWFPGMSRSRKQMSIVSLHEAAKASAPGSRLLEVSSASENALGEKLSAFNLTFHTRSQTREITVESAFQSAKVFENGGPYPDLTAARPLDAKRDPRLQNSGRLVAFRFSGQDWPLTPLTAFYDWIYVNALHRRSELAEAVLDYDAFSDISFNPEKSVNCQAGSVALYVSLKRRDLLQEALTSPDNYFTVISGADGKGVRSDDSMPAQLL
jgi:hypothetical protein